MSDKLSDEKALGEKGLTEKTRDGARGARVAKLLARAGVASRREIERMIANGRVALHGQVLSSPARVLGTVDGLTVDGRPVALASRTRLWRYHKPFGLVTTHRDPQGRPTVFAHLPPGLPRVISVGRLDRNTEGLLLLTNDGALARHLELPATGLRREYRVRVHGRVDDRALAALRAGLTLDGLAYGPIVAWREMRGRGAVVRAAQGAREGTWLRMRVYEGKNREIRNVLRYLGLSILQLVRIAYGPYVLGDLAPGAVEEAEVLVGPTEGHVDARGRQRG